MRPRGLEEAMAHLQDAMLRLPGLERIAETQLMRNLLLVQVDGLRMSLARARIATETAARDSARPGAA